MPRIVYQVGDIVEIARDQSSHRFEIGSRVRLISRSSENTWYAQSLDGSISRFISILEIRTEFSFQPGDRVICIDESEGRLFHHTATVRKGNYGISRVDFVNVVFDAPKPSRNDGGYYSRSFMPLFAETEAQIITNFEVVQAVSSSNETSFDLTSPSTPGKIWALVHLPGGDWKATFSDHDNKNVPVYGRQLFALAHAIDNSMRRRFGIEPIRNADRMQPITIGNGLTMSHPAIPDVAANSGYEWTAEDSEAASAEGWDVFEQADETMLIERDDEAKVFSTDRDAVSHVLSRAETSPLHIKAMSIHLASRKKDNALYLLRLRHESKRDEYLMQRGHTFTTENLERAGKFFAFEIDMMQDLFRFHTPMPVSLAYVGARSFDVVEDESTGEKLWWCLYGDGVTSSISRAHRYPDTHILRFVSSGRIPIDEVKDAIFDDFVPLKFRQPVKSAMKEVVFSFDMGKESFDSLFNIRFGKPTLLAHPDVMKSVDLSDIRPSGPLIVGTSADVIIKDDVVTPEEPQAMCEEFELTAPDSLTHDEALDAMIVWEAVLAYRQGNANIESLNQCFEDIGAGQMRHNTIALTRQFVLPVWRAMPEDYTDFIDFDWGFVPDVLQHIPWRETADFAYGRPVTVTSAQIAQARDALVTDWHARKSEREANA